MKLVILKLNFTDSKHFNIITNILLAQLASISRFLSSSVTFSRSNLQYQKDTPNATPNTQARTQTEGIGNTTKTLNQNDYQKLRNESR